MAKKRKDAKPVAKRKMKKVKGGTTLSSSTVGGNFLKFDDGPVWGGEGPDLGGGRSGKGVSDPKAKK